MKVSYLESQWILYRDACYPGIRLGVTQENETRQAFFAGCLVVLLSMLEGCQNLPEEQAYLHLVGLIDEAKRVCAERAKKLKGRN